jgi:hypothetical protein
VDSQDAELADILQNLENTADVDEDSVLGSQALQELGNETIDGSDVEDMQDLSQSLDAAVDSNPDDSFQKENLNRYPMKIIWNNGGGRSRITQRHG